MCSQVFGGTGGGACPGCGGIDERQATAKKEAAGLKAQVAELEKEMRAGNWK